LTASEVPDRVGQLLLASKVGASRELFEETGIDIRSELDRLLPPFLHPQTDEVMPNESENRIYYFLIVTDADFPKSETGSISVPMNAKADAPFHHVRLRLSHEHSGFTFQVDTAQAAEDIKWHSGGKNAVALRKALQIEEPAAHPNNDVAVAEEDRIGNDNEPEGETLLAERSHSVPGKAKLMCCFKWC
jgi:hypothetical protein